MEERQTRDDREKEEMEAAWREMEIADAEADYYRNEQIANEIQQSYIEKEMREDGYSARYIRFAMGDNYLNAENDNSDGGYDDRKIDNTDLSYSKKYVYIRLNKERGFEKRLSRCAEKLIGKYPEIKKIQTDDILQTILDNEFRDGFRKDIFIRNLTIGNEKNRTIAIRPEIAPGDYLLDLLPEGVTLVFRGHIYGREFIVDYIYDAADTEQLDFEVSASVIPQKNAADVKYNFLFDIVNDAESLTLYTGERLGEWKEYLQWNKQICNRRLDGLKYYRFDYDTKKKQIIFWIVCESKEYFDKRKRYLSEFQVFDNEYSENSWVFKFAAESDSSKRRRRGIELGTYRNYAENHVAERTSLHEERSFDFDDYDYYESTDSHSSEDTLTEEDVFQAFDQPYIVQVVYDLPMDITEKSRNDDFFDIDDQQNYTYEEKKYISEISPNGFLALSAAGELTLVQRFERAISSLERDRDCYSPNLAAWLFNITQARLPKNLDDVVITRWLNPDIAKNENQKEAVRKILAAPDICLIQGPPGTGKTTVIAEAVYQLAVQGNRILVASQSNDAVDNALERLANTPDIRAIRLGQKSRKKKNRDLGKQKFAEDDALKYYYQALSLGIREKWLEPWERLEEQRGEYLKDAADVRNYQLDIAEYQTTLNRIIKELQQLRNDDISLKKKIHLINDKNSRILRAKQNASVFEGVVNGDFESSLFLTEQQLRIAERVMNPIIENEIKNDILLSLDLLDFDRQGEKNESEYLRILISRIPILEKICEKLKAGGTQSSHNESSNLILKNRIKEIEAKIIDAYDNDDYAAMAELRKMRDEIKIQMAAAHGSAPVVQLGAVEKGILSQNITEKISSGNISGICERIEVIISEAKAALQKTLMAIMVYTNKLELADISDLNNEQKAINSRIAQKKDEVSTIQSMLEKKRSTLMTLAQKYKASSANADVVSAAIAQALSITEKKLSDAAIVREKWESMFRQFNDRLNDEQAFDCDLKYYQPIYVNSCNVVGITCTDDMRALTNNGYDDFDVVIIDEVSKATPPELLIPLMKARKAVLVGDHRQLPPTFKEHEKSYKELISDRESIPEELRDIMTEDNFRRFRGMVTSSLFKEYFERADDSIRHSLLVQYRMHSDIMRVINRFYEGRLENGLTAEQENTQKAHGLTVRGADDSEFIVPTKHAYWLDSSCLPSGTPVYDSKSNKKTRNEGGTSVYNTLEQYMIIELLKRMADSLREQYEKNKIKKTVGVISFYQAQVNRIRRSFRDTKKSGFDFSPLDVDINTVDRFQGKEKNIIITSLVTNSPSGWASKHVITFERINVAFSRAQQLLVIVGAKHTYEQQKIELPNMDNTGTSTVSAYQNIMQEMYRKGCFKSSEKLITPELEALIKKYDRGNDE